MLALSHATTASLDGSRSAVALRSGTAKTQAADPATLEGHLGRAPLRTFAAKEHVFTEGDPRANLYRIESGAVCMYKVMPDGRRQVLGFAYAGDLIGDPERLGLDALFPTFFVAILVAELRRPGARVVALAGARTAKP